MNVVLMRLPETIVSLCGLEGCVQPAWCTAAVRSRMYVSEHAQVLQHIRSCMFFFVACSKSQFREDLSYRWSLKRTDAVTSTVADP
jgi:hypothetical protein